MHPLREGLWVSLSSPLSLFLSLCLCVCLSVSQLSALSSQPSALSSLRGTKRHPSLCSNCRHNLSDRVDWLASQSYSPPLPPPDTKKRVLRRVPLVRVHDWSVRELVLLGPLRRPIRATSGDVHRPLLYRHIFDRFRPVYHLLVGRQLPVRLCELFHARSSTVCCLCCKVQLLTLFFKGCLVGTFCRHAGEGLFRPLSTLQICSALCELGTLSRNAARPCSRALAAAAVLLQLSPMLCADGVRLGTGFPVTCAPLRI